MQLTDVNKYARWVVNIKFDAVEGMWEARFFPNRIVKTPEFTSVVTELNKHVVDEIIGLVADVLRVTPEEIKSKSQLTAVAEARHVVATVLRSKFRVSLQSIAQALNYNTHVALYNAFQACKQRPATRKKLQKVYRAYPWLYRRNEKIN